ncbi:formylmethanofuran dehydrogenase [Desulfonema ishimotonii]|uniref:Formylmethanofuran dehydrogenase n=1 Tax=Desulfonema ishimotonii TaxID=45657 RepID=A0A401G029_9BACT|nr:FmdE family protein [Desulfonema ishimotonii]GBC62575.1 formylmethanofuran dehydrogenase [Desulfonema ishimotonii]
MNAQDILNSEDFKKCADFHGHICPGLSTGFRAASAGMAWLKANRSEDEEIVAIVETDACSADAVQVLTGCTFGKGNFIYKDYGKMALTLMSRKSGRGVRVIVRNGAFQPDEEHMALIQKMIREELTDEERNRFETLHFRRSCQILEMPEDQLFDIRAVDMELPRKAEIKPSVACDRCGESTMSSKLVEKDGQKVCRGCLEGV